MTHALAADDSVVALRQECRFDSFEPAAVIETEVAVFTFEGIDPSLFTSVLNRLDGTQSLTEIAADVRADAGAVRRICASLDRHELLTRSEAGAATRATEENFAKVCYQWFPAWKRRVFGHALWTSLADGTASRTQFAGWLLETYHFIETVNSRLALAVAECRNVEARDLLLHHYTEEWDHHHFFMAGLRSFGFDPEVVLGARPIPGTLAVVNCMRNAARRDPLHYAACSGFLESTGEDRTAGRQFFAQLIRHYCPDNPDVIQPMIKHLDLDEDYGHNGMLSLIYPTLGFVTAGRLAGAVGAVAELVETLDLWSTDILRTYAHEASLPGHGVRRYRPNSSPTSVLEPRGDA
jgi:pyrroloquinoline quinone (PQQ) biosynthesis protein C